MDKNEEKPKRTCKIRFLANEIGQKVGRPNHNRYHPSRKRLLAAGLQVGRKARRMQRATA